MFEKYRTDITSLELVPGSGGVFEVTVDGMKVYSKKETGQYPTVDEVAEKMDQHRRPLPAVLAKEPGR